MRWHLLIPFEQVTGHYTDGINGYGFLEVQKPLWRIDDHSSRGEVDFFNDLLDGGHQILLFRSLDNIEFAARRRPDPGDHADPLSRKSVNFETYDLIVIILPRLQRFENVWVDADGGPDPFPGVVNPIDAPQLDENLALILFARLDLVRRPLALFLDNQLTASSENGGFRIEGVNF